jgi:sulfur-oxidizing protein SoxY
MHFSRRTVLTGLACALGVRPVQATPDLMEAAIADFTKGRPMKPGRVKLDLPPLVENGNAVPLTVSVESPMSADDFIARIALFNEKNPQPNIAVFHLTPFSGRAAVSTRIRLGDSQFITAIAETNKGELFVNKAELVVTLPACAEN